VRNRGLAKNPARLTMLFALNNLVDGSPATHGSTGMNAPAARHKGALAEHNVGIWRKSGPAIAPALVLLNLRLDSQHVTFGGRGSVDLP